MRFDENLGQSDPAVKFLWRGADSTIFLTERGPVLSLSSRVDVPPAAAGRAAVDDTPQRGVESVLSMEFVGAARAPTIVGSGANVGKTSYFHGVDPSRWMTVASYQRVDYRQLYPGIDLAFYGSAAGELEYDVIVAPGADVGDVAIRFEGADAVRIGRAGELLVDTPAGRVVQRAPVAYQVSEGKRRPVRSQFVLAGKRTVAFEVGLYDRSLPLVIDPVVTYSTLLGGSGQDEGQDIVVDDLGNMYITGDTSSANFPVAGLGRTYGGSRDAFVAKLSADGSQLLFAAYLGGTGEERARSLAVDAAHNVYVGGATFSTDYPTTPGSFQPASGGDQDAYVTKLNAAGDAIVYSTYLGGSQGDGRTNIAVNSQGEAYLSGFTFSTTFPTKNPVQAVKSANADAWVSKLNAAGDGLIYSTFLGGNQNDTARGITFDAAGNAYVGGWSFSSNFPVTPGAYQRVLGGAVDAFVTKLTPSGTSLAFSTFVGGAGEDWPYLGACIALDAAGNIHLTGRTNSTNFPTVNAIQAVYGGGEQDAFVFKLTNDGSSLVYSTYMGGLKYDQGVALDVDPSGSADVIGYTNSDNFPTVNALQSTRKGNHDAFVAKLNPSGGLIHSTYLGGKGDDYGYGVESSHGGVVHIVGFTQSTNFPLVNPYQSTRVGTPADVFVAKIAFPTTLSVADAATVEGGPGTTATLDFLVSLSQASQSEVSVAYATANSSAQAPGDYETASGTLTFAPGETTKTVSVAVHGDADQEANETLTLVLSNATVATILDGSGVGTITDDDTPPSLSVSDATVVEGAPGASPTLAFVVTLSPTAPQAATVAYATSDVTAHAPGDYETASGTLTFAPGETTKTVPVTVHGDADAELTETLNLVLSDPAGAAISDGSAVGSITDDDTPSSLSVSDVAVVEGAAGATPVLNFVVSLSPSRQSSVSVAYGTVDGTAQAPGDYDTTSGTITFAPGETTKTVAVTVRGDAIQESNETLHLVLSNPTNATISDGSGLGTINDDDNGVTVSVSDASVVEGRVLTPFVFSLSRASTSIVDIRYTTANDSAVAPGDYTTKRGTARIEPGQTSVIVNVGIGDDTLAEGTEVFKMTITGASGATVADGVGVGTILDND